MEAATVDVQVRDESSDVEASDGERDEDEKEKKKKKRVGFRQKRVYM